MNLSRLVWPVTFLYLAISFFSPFGYSSSYSNIVQIGYLALILLCSLPTLRLCRFENSTLIAFFLLVLLLLVNIIASEYQVAYLANNLITAFTCLIIAEVDGTRPRRKTCEAFHLLSTIIISLLLLFTLVRYGFYALGGMHIETAPVLLGYPEVNNTALFFFIYFWMSVKLKKGVGIVLSCIYPLFYFGRQYIAMLLLATVLLVLRKGVPARLKYFVIGKKGLILSIALSGLIGIWISSLWITYVIPSGVSEYKESINDESNAGRMVSIHYSFETLISDPRFLYRGLDNDIFSEYGISTTDSSRDSNTYIDGYRLTQPHQEVVNQLVKCGLINTILYYFIIAKYITHYARFIDSAFLISYVFGSLILHGMFEGIWIITVLAVVAIPSEER